LASVIWVGGADVGWLGGGWVVMGGKKGGGKVFVMSKEDFGFEKSGLWS
jgi:hypothetical protein